VEGEITKTEQKVVELVLMGLSNKRIAKELGIVEGTVKLHLNRIFRKFGVATRVQLVLKVVEGG
jgi:DNA-binding NarL/FixJ family response regulator